MVAPALGHAAAKNGHVMNDLDLFLQYAIHVERDAARRFEDLMHAMHTAGNRELEKLFKRLGELSRMHLKSAIARSGFHDLPELRFDELEWPDGVTPEAASWTGADDGIDALAALELALAGERSGHAYYETIAEQSSDPEVRQVARSFAEEEAQHVAELERWIDRLVA